MPVAGALLRLKGFIVRLSSLPKLFSTVALSALLPVTAQAQSNSAAAAAAKMLPARVGEFNAQGAPRSEASEIFGRVKAEDYGVVSQARRDYVSADGRKFGVLLVKTGSVASAYSLLTHVASAYYPPQSSPIKLGEVGTASVAGPGQVSFSKGATFVQVTDTGEQENKAAPTDFARLFAESFESGGELPVLVLHLPEWEKMHQTAGYAVSLPALKHAAGNAPVLDALSFDGGAEAVTAKYGDARLVIVEYTTPQYAEENDKRISERVAQLRGAGQPAPTAYKRVGNYSVFVFDAKDASEAERLLAGVKYEKDVRWLGRNPHGDEIAQRAYTNTMTSVVVTVFKTSGLAIALSLGIGAVFGGIVFMRRRARVSAVQAYSDGGEMLRLNLLEDVTAPPRTANLLGQGKD